MKRCNVKVREIKFLFLTQKCRFAKTNSRVIFEIGDSQKLICANFSKLVIREKQFPRNFSRIDEPQILEFLSDIVSF